MITPIINLFNILLTQMGWSTVKANQIDNLSHRFHDFGTIGINQQDKALAPNSLKMSSISSVGLKRFRILCSSLLLPTT